MSVRVCFWTVHCQDAWLALVQQATHPRGGRGRASWPAIGAANKLAESARIIAEASECEGEACEGQRQQASRMWCVSKKCSRRQDDERAEGANLQKPSTVGVTDGLTHDPRAKRKTQSLKSRNFPAHHDHGAASVHNAASAANLLPHACMAHSMCGIRVGRSRARPLDSGKGTTGLHDRDAEA